MRFCMSDLWSASGVYSIEILSAAIRACIAAASIVLGGLSLVSVLCPAGSDGSGSAAGLT